MESEQVQNCLAKLAAIRNPLGEATHDFLRFKHMGGLRDNSMIRYTTTLLVFVRFCRKRRVRRVEDISHKLLQKYCIRIFETYGAQSTRYSYVVSVKLFLKYMMARKRLNVSLMDLDQVKAPKMTEQLPDIMSPKRVLELLAAPDRRRDPMYQRDIAILELMYGTGMRATEVTGLKIGDIKWDESYIRCKGKGGKTRLLPMTPKVKRTLRKWLEHRDGKTTTKTPRRYQRPGRTLFLSRTGRPLGRIELFRFVKRYGARIGEPDIHPHTLRHCFATHLLNAGVNIRSIQQLLGHASIMTTQIYLNLSITDLKRAMRKHPRR